jgi:hypothetical protein
MELILTKSPARLTCHVKVSDTSPARRGPDDANLVSHAGLRPTTDGGASVGCRGCSTSGFTAEVHNTHRGRGRHGLG